MEKVCTKCGESKALEKFPRDKRERDGRKSECLVCKRLYEAKRRERPDERARANERVARYRERHPEKVAASLKRSYHKHYDKRLSGMKRWRDQNPETVKAAGKRWRKNNLERKNELQKEYAKRHPEKVLANARRQEMKRRGKGDDPSAESREYMALIRHDRCSYCDEPMENVDHIAPRAEWNMSVPGWNQWENLTSACQRCNRQKHDKPLLHFLLEKD